MPSFGRDTIRRFASNCSEMKNLAARDFENLLQVRVLIPCPFRSLRCLKCAITVFDGLLPEPHNRTVTELLFIMAHWHAMAKFRIHNNLTLAILDATTVSLGRKLRAFRDTTCPAFATKELCREYNARIRRDAKKAASNPPANQGTSNPPANQGTHSPEMTETQPQATALPTPHTGRRPKTLNLNTFKGHSLGDYADIIRIYGTSDSFSTEPVRGHRPIL
jgi:hypothetical protein